MAFNKRHSQKPDLIDMDYDVRRVQKPHSADRLSYMNLGQKPNLTEVEDDTETFCIMHGQQPLASATNRDHHETLDRQLYITTDPDHSPQSHLVLLPIGKTGDGKSSLLNAMFGYPEFKAMTRLKSVTETIDERTGIWSVGKSNAIVTVADTPGFADTERRDVEFQAQLKTYIKDLGQRLGIDAFLLVAKYNSSNVMTILETFATMMKDFQPATWWNHVVLVFTHVDYNPRPKANVAQRKSNIVTSLTGQIRTKFGLTEAPPVVFVSSKEVQCNHSVSTGGQCDCSLAHAFKNDRMRILRRVINSASQDGRWFATQD